jgi:hypothetical protein
MTNFTEHNLNQKAIYWGNPQNDGFGGFTYADPIEIDCRWEDEADVYTSKDGSQVGTSSKVRVKQDLEVDAMLLLGLLDDLESANYNDPKVAGAYPIRALRNVPTVKGHAISRIVLL